MHSENLFLPLVEKPPAPNSQIELSPIEVALAAAVLEVARIDVKNIAENAPALRRFALFKTSELLASAPALANLLGAETLNLAKDDPNHLSSVELETIHDHPEAELASATWPKESVGGILASWIDTQFGKKRVAVGALVSSESITSVYDPSDPNEFQLGVKVLVELEEMLRASLGI